MPDQVRHDRIQNLVSTVSVVVGLIGFYMSRRQDFMTDETYDVIILGCGPAGLQVPIHAVRCLLPMDDHASKVKLPEIS